MDSKVGFIADYASSVSFTDLPEAVVHHCKRIVVDTFGVALAAFDAEPSRIAREIAQRTSVVAGAQIMGTDHRTLPELAAFANGVMVRYLDGNDAYPGHSGGHVSDTIPAILAVADITRAEGRAIINSIVLCYEVCYNLSMATRVRDKGMDAALYIAVASAAGAAKLLGLDRSRIAQAISLAVTPNIALVATRYGHLSMWKGCAGGNAARNGVFAALLAAAGMTGPEKPMEGDHGLEKLVGKFELSAFAGDGRPYRIMENTLKCFLTEAHSISPIMATLQLSEQVKVDDIEKVTVYTYWFAWDVIGREPEKWRPKTRETADHSLPYIIAAVLIDRSFSEDIFSDERLQDPRIMHLIDKIEIKEDAAITRQFPEKIPCRVEILTKNGVRKVATNDYPRGHYKNPMSDDEVNAKFRRLVQRVLPQSRVSRALDVLWQLDRATDLDSIFEAVRIPIGSKT